MIRLLLVTKTEERRRLLLPLFEKQEGRTVSAVDSGEQAVSEALAGEFDLVVVDEDLGDMTGLVLVERLVAANPMLNCAAVTSLSKADFHEASEGMGVLGSLPISPSKADVDALMDHLSKVLSLSAL